MKRWISLIWLVLLALGGSVMAQQPPAKSMVTLTWDDFVKITGYDPNRKDGQVLTIPWSEVEALLGVKVDKVGKGTSVDLPWQDFKALLQWSLEKQGGGALNRPPTGYAVTSSELSGTLAEEGAELTLKLGVEVLEGERWQRIPVLPSSVAITRTSLPEGVYLNNSGGTYELLVRKAGSLKASLSFSAAVAKEKGISQVVVSRVLPAAMVLDLTVPREGVEVKVVGAQSLVSKATGGKTQVAAAIPPGMDLRISWERALPKVEAMPAKLYAETRTLLAVAEGVLIGQELVTYNILHTAVREVKLSVPAGVNILTVSGPSVEDWRVQGEELLVALRGEALGELSLAVSYELPGAERLLAPVLRAKGVEREKGFVGVVALSNLEMVAGEVTGARAVDARQLPPDLVAMTSQPILLAFRYVGESFSIPLTAKKHDEVGMVVTIVDSGLFTAMQLNDGRRITKVVYSVRNNRNQFLRVKMPAGAEIWSVEVAGRTASPARDESGHVLLPLLRSAAGDRELTAFPVELVYVEAPKEVAEARGRLELQLPSVDVPLMHCMLNYYLPEEGKYKVGEGDTEGTLRPVKAFTQLVAGDGRQLVELNASEEAMQMQQQLNARADAQARAAGAQPIRVRLPVNGRRYLFEKLLTLPGDPLSLALPYKGWENGQ